jgi:ankyrin repeat protein
MSTIGSSGNLINLADLSAHELNKAAKKCVGENNTGTLQIKCGNMNYEATIKKKHWYNKPKIVNVELCDRNFATANKQLIEKLKNTKGHSVKKMFSVAEQMKQVTNTLQEKMDSCVSAPKTLNCEEVKALIECGADVNSKSQGLSLLALAAQSGNLDMVKYLVDEGAEIDAETLERVIGKAKCFNEEIFDFLLSKTDMKSLHCAEGTLALFAALNSNVAALKAVVAKDPEQVNQPDSHGRTPLMRAAREGKGEMMQVLIAAGANVNAIDDQGNTAYTSAAMGESEEAMKVLEDTGVLTKDLTKRTDGLTAAELLTNKKHERQDKAVFKKIENLLKEEMTPENIQKIKDLAAQVTDFNREYKEQGTILSEAVKADNLEAAKALIEAGAKPGAKSSYGYTALHYAIGKDNSNIDMLKLLFEKENIDLDAKDRYGRTLLGWAVGARNFDGVKLLIDKGADIHLKANITMGDPENAKDLLDIAKNELKGEQNRPKEEQNSHIIVKLLKIIASLEEKNAETSG